MESDEILYEDDEDPNDENYYANDYPEESDEEKEYNSDED
jgi:hypothetical protein